MLCIVGEQESTHAKFEGRITLWCGLVKERLGNTRPIPFDDFESSKEVS